MRSIKTTTFTAGLRLCGLAAPMIIDGATDGDVLRAYVKTVLFPELNPGDVIVMDNQPAHRVIPLPTNPSASWLSETAPHLDFPHFTRCSREFR
jgi:hypothetical protein